MTPALLLTATAVARAAAHLDDPAASERQLAPSHPAFIGFRRMTYAWESSGDRHVAAPGIHAWIALLRARAVTRIWLDCTESDGVVRTAHVHGTDAWRVRFDGTHAVMSGNEEAAVQPPTMTLDAAAIALRRALEHGIDTGQTPMRRAELLRSIAILDSQGDGGEVSDVSWPYFLLPERGYDAAARRLLAAAANSWPEQPLLVPENDASPPFARALLSAVQAAVNSVRMQQVAPVPSPESARVDR